jgi:hypothetical protein
LLDEHQPAAGFDEPVIRRDVAAQQNAPMPGVITTIADGFSMVLWRPFVVVIPLLLDAWYWLGWKVELGAFAVQLRQWLIDAGVSRTDGNLVRVARFSQWDATTMPSFFFVPSLLADVSPSKLYMARPKEIFSTSSWRLDLLILVGLVLAGVGLSAAFLVMLANAARDREQSAGQFLRTTLKVSVRLLGAVGLAAVAVAALFGPLAGIWAATSAAGADLGPIFALLALVLGVALFAMFWFAPDAIVMSDAGPIEAVKRSASVVRSFFWQSLGFLAASTIISIGLGDLWLRLADSAPGLLIGVIANALFSSGLAIASFLFYSSRIQRSRYATKSKSGASRTAR